MQKTLNTRHIEPLNLSPFQRILITTDGILTKILEAYLLEKIKLVKLSEKLVTITKPIPALDLDIDVQVIERKILLQGNISFSNFIYVESIIVPERLDNRLKSRLIESQEPRDRLWLEYKVETFKQIINVTIENFENLSKYFNIAREENILFRAYRVFYNKKIITKLFS